MPDWSYHPLKKLLLDKMSPPTSREFIHQSMSTIASFPGGRSLIGFLGHMTPPKELQKEINQTRFQSPIGLSGHIDPHLSGINAFQELGFGFIEIGPIVLKEPKEQIEPIKENNQVLFAKNHEKLPLKLAIRKLTRLNIRIPVFAKIDDSVTRNEWEIIVEQLTPFVDAFIGTNQQISSWVEKGVRSFYISHSPEVDFEITNLHPLVAGVVLNAPRQTYEGFWRETAIANTTLAKAVEKVKAFHPELIVITSGGVESPEEASKLVDAGADLLILTDGYVIAGPGLPKRINERLLFEKNPPISKQNWSWSFLFGLSILIGGFIAFYFAFTSVILPYDESFIGLKRSEIMLINPLILSFMLHDRMSLAGTMISGGILYIQLARHGIRYGTHWTKVAFNSAAIVGFLGILLFIGYGYFDWLHGIFWLLLWPIYYFSLKEGKNATAPPFSSHGRNDKAWKYGLYGQLMFVILGALILIGGIVISAIGVSNVFVATDISYLCMPPEMLEGISKKLIPVIAHDRAGFGSALISVGLLVLMISLWGYRKGESWIWNTLALGALPAFIAGLGTHFYIGYTTFIHLLPVYFLVILYLLGLVLSYPFLKKK
ncbi:dihydroorotate dehydrogenase [Pseudoneobacillus sp. C159]